MANIDSYIQAIETASRGEEVRDSIVLALEAINDDITGGIPLPTVLDAGKVLAVNSYGNWTLKSFTAAEEVGF